MAQNNNIKKRTGPWKPGESGNPGGRPKGFGDAIRARFGRNGEALIAFLAQVLDGTAYGDDLVTFRDADGPVSEVVKVGPTIREKLEAVKILRDSGYGKPVTAIELSGPGGGPVAVATRVDVEALSDGELEILEALAEKATPKLPAAPVEDAECVS